MIRFVFTKREIAIAMVAGLVFGLLTGSSARAQQAPRANCVAVTKQEYNNARKAKLQQQRFGQYVRSGRVLKRFYWFCSP
jgi:hypothetical protein